MSKPRKQHPWYNYDKVLSYNAVINFIVGVRGNGKTYGAKKYALRRWVKHREQFVLLRRFGTELDTRHTFFADIAHEFPDYDFRVYGKEAQAAHVETRDDKKRRWETIGFFVALSAQQKLKGTSYHRVTTIIFDEFILEKGFLRELPNEVQAFLNFYSTVDRNQDKTRAFLLANAISIESKYFRHWKIVPDELPEISLHADGLVLAHFIDSGEFSESVGQTRFGKLVEGTEFAQMAMHNKFKDAHKELVEQKPATAKYFYTLETKEGTFSVWVDNPSGMMFAQQKRPGNEKLLTLVAENMAPNKKLMTHTSNTISALRTAFRQGRLMFDSASTRNAYLEVFPK